MQSKGWILFGTSLAAIIIAIDFTIINVSLEAVQTDLKADLGQLQWLINGFGISFCALLVILGRVGDILGRRKILYLGLVGFALASLAAGCAHNPLMLILLRVLQGLFGAGIIPCGMAITANAFSARERGRALGVYSSVVGLGLALGPLIGGLIISVSSWRWIFFINIPVCILSLIICLCTIREKQTSVQAWIDWRGSFLLMLVLSCANLLLTQKMAWQMIVITGIFGLSTYALFKVEKKALVPIIPLRLFKNTDFLLALVAYCVAAGFAWPVLFFMPLYLNKILAYSYSKTGIMLASMTGMTAVAPAIAGYYFDKYGPKKLLHSLFLLCCSGFGLFFFLNTQGPQWLILLGLCLFGAGWGIGNGITTPIALSRSSGVEDAGLISGALTTAMNCSAVLALSLTTALFNAQLPQDVAQEHSMTYKLTFVAGLHKVYLGLFLISLVCWWLARRLMKR